MNPPATVAEISEPDLDEVADFLARQVRPGDATIEHSLSPRERLRWLLLENPRRKTGIPLGWRIRGKNNAIAGAAVCLPFRVGAADFVTTALMFAKFFVDVPYRGMGLGILMRFVREGKRFPLFCTSTNAVAGELFAKLGATKIAGMDHTMLGVARPRPLVEELIYRKTGSDSLSRVLAFPATIAPGMLRPGYSRDLSPGQTDSPGSSRSVHSPDPSSDDEGGAPTSLRKSKIQSELRPAVVVDDLVAINLSRPRNSLAVIRDRDYLYWRYFTGDREKHVYCFYRNDDEARMVVVNLVRAGYRGQIRVLNVLDVWPPTTPAAAFELWSALANRYRGKFDVIWFRSQPTETEDALVSNGFRRHVFPALGWCIDKEKMLPTPNWYLVPGESE